ncbi:MAG TPA: FUSC family protein [Jatrophihabitans sp.]|uniref:FUSC family protein n=1 Tax=Jatrophihabitans sp. TaxID=1932789 RepID=UPI002E0A7148|nr:FUSC family protein [Jatrophihabitans sp.]
MGTIAGGAALGLATTIGALQTGFADRPGPYRLRMLRMLGTGLAAAITSGVAVVASRSDAASVLLLLVLALGAGLLVTAGPSATQVGIAGVAAALILGHTPQPPSVALHVALLVFAGGAIQTVLALAGWPLRRHQPERAALAKLYRELAGAARSPRGAVAGPPAADTLTAVRQTLYGLGHDHGPSVEAYRVLLDEAERIRREIVVVTAATERLSRDRNPILAGLVRAALGSAGDVLDEIAAALDVPRPVADAVLEQARAAVKHAIARLENSAEAPGEPTRLATAARLRALSGQLRAAVESTRTGASEGRRGEERGTATARLLRDPVAILRANLTPDSAVLRHGVRIALLVAASDLVVRLMGLDRGYWVSLTILVVLRPDFGATLQRSVLRSVGTIVGLLVATELVHRVPGGDWWHVALVAVFAFGMRFAGPGNVGLSAVGLSGLVVILLAIQGVPPGETFASRALATLVGGGLAVLAALALPAWERQFVPARLAALLAAYHDYLRAVADPATDRESLDRARAASRLARSNAQASIDRARAEPVRGQAQVELGQTVLAHTHRFVHATLTLDAVRRPVREGGGVPELEAFLAAAGEALEAIRVAVRDGATPEPTPKLRPRQDALAAALTADPDRVGGRATATTLVQATDRITNSLDTLAVELRRQHVPA